MTDSLETQEGLPGDADRALQQFNQQDEKGLDYFIDQFYPLIYSYVFRHLRNKADSEEIANDVFLAVFWSKQVFDSITGLKRYLYVTAHNKCLLRLKILQKEREEYKKYKAFLQENSRGKEIDVEAVYSDLLSTINKMSEEEKMIIRKSVMEGRKNKDVAEELTIKDTTLGTIKFRALEKFRKVLGLKGKK